MTYLKPREVKKFFTDESQGMTGFLKVDDYCRGSDVKPHELGWSHAYIIERHKDDCFILQSNNRQYSVGQWLQKDLRVTNFFEPTLVEKYPKFFEPVYREVNQMKDALGLDEDVPPGMPCKEMYERYERAYPEKTAIRAYQQHCLQYELWKMKKQDVSADMIKLMELQIEMLRSVDDEIIPAYRVSTLNLLLDCGDTQWRRLWSKIKRHEEPNSLRPGAAIAYKLLFPTNKVAQALRLFTSGRRNSLSGLPLQCAAIASVPISIPK